MLKRLEQKQLLWGGVDELIDQWLAHRKTLLIAYCKLASLPPYEATSPTLPNISQTTHFCEQLVDYVSEGHFDVFNKIIEPSISHNADNEKSINQILSKIIITTNQILDFNDKYSKVTHDEALFQLDTDLEQLTHHMEQRFQLEDDLLALLYQQQSQTKNTPTNA